MIDLDAPEVRAAVLQDLVMTAVVRVSTASARTLEVLQTLIFDEEWSEHPHEKTIMKALLAYIYAERQERQAQEAQRLTYEEQRRG